MIYVNIRIKRGREGEEIEVRWKANFGMSFTYIHTFTGVSIKGTFQHNTAAPYWTALCSGAIVPVWINKAPAKHVFPVSSVSANERLSTSFEAT